VTKGELIIEQRTLESGCPVVAWPGRDALYATYDPGQISEARAISALTLLVPEMPEVFRVTRIGDGRDEPQSRILQSMAPDDMQERAG
jgi:hypothetical protein